MSDGRCAHCGSELPCACAGSAGTDTFDLLPCPGQQLIEDEERFTRLLREVKQGVVRREFVASSEASPLLERVRRLGMLIEGDRLVEADDVARDCLGDVLEFPRRKPDRRALVVPVLAAALAIAAFWWFVIR